jgi:RHS Repeat
MTTMPKPSDLTANYTLTFDAWNRLVKVADGATTVAEYEYDGLNHRTVKKTYVSGTLDETRHFYYDKDWRCLEERVGTSTDADRRYVWGMTYIDDLILRDRMIVDGSDTTVERLWAMTDANYNVVNLIEITNGGYTLTDLERYTYDAYGNPTVRDKFYNRHRLRLATPVHRPAPRPRNRPIPLPKPPVPPGTGNVRNKRPDRV